MTGFNILVLQVMLYQQYSQACMDMFLWPYKAPQSNPWPMYASIPIV